MTSSFKIPLFDIDWTLLKGSESNQVHHEAITPTSEVETY